MARELAVPDDVGYRRRRRQRRVTMLYIDARGVSRVYRMTLADGVWTVWREMPGFHQRYVGRISPDGSTITGGWEASDDGSTWRPDFELGYTKVE